MKKKEPFVRINSRIRQDQVDFIKKYATEKNISEGEAHRIMIDFFVLKNKKVVDVIKP